MYILRILISVLVVWFGVYIWRLFTEGIDFECNTFEACLTLIGALLISLVLVMGLAYLWHMKFIVDAIINALTCAVKKLW